MASGAGSCECTASRSGGQHNADTWAIKQTRRAKPSTQAKDIRPMCLCVSVCVSMVFHKVNKQIRTPFYLMCKRRVSPGDPHRVVVAYQTGVWCKTKQGRVFGYFSPFLLLLLLRLNSLCGLFMLCLCGSDGPKLSPLCVYYVVVN